MGRLYLLVFRELLCYETFDTLHTRTEATGLSEELGLVSENVGQK